MHIRGFVFLAFLIAYFVLCTATLINPAFSIRLSRRWASKFGMEQRTPAIFFSATCARFVATAGLVMLSVMVVCAIRYPEVFGFKAN